MNTIRKLTLLSSISIMATMSVCYAQITYQNNSIRSGDEIIKQQVEYKDPGREGDNVIWDFSSLESINDEYCLTYRQPKLRRDSIYVLGKDTLQKHEVRPEDLITGVEHYTSYFYRVKDNQLLQLGHKNAVSLMHYREPIPVLSYPMDYGQIINSSYTAETVYSGTEHLYFGGDVSILSDAQGIMILPNKDTLRHVTRIKTIRTIIEDQDSFEKKIAPLPDSVKQKIDPKPFNSRIESYCWYVKGYRYPVFETIKNITIKDSIESDYFATAFFYPPVDHYYLEDDPDNLAVLDSLNSEQANPIAPISWIQENFTYNYGPNPVSGILTIEYHLEQDATVGITLYSSMYGVVKTIAQQNRPSGLYTETIDCHGLYPGAYILRFDVRDESVSNVIIKH